MTEKDYQTPNNDENNERPLAITIVCIIGFLGALVAVPLIFSDLAKSIGSWYPFYLAISSIIGLACFVGFWKMKKLAVFIYIGFVGLNQIILLVTGNWNIGALLIPGVIISIALYYSKKMK